MKNLLYILVLLLFISSNSFSNEQLVDCTIEIPSTQFIVEGSGINPGDVICLLAGEKDFLLFNDIQGTESQPITIINSGGAVIIDTDHFYGIKFDNCKHIIFSGNGDENLQYGIQIQRVGNGAGMSIDNMSTNVEIEFVEISYTYIAGIYAKTEPYQGNCDNLITRDVFTMYDLKIHDCYLHDIGDEGLYVGSSKYTGQTISQCNNIVVLPHIIEGVAIYNNVVERTGWDGIQVSSSPVDCSIFNNLVSYDSFEEEYGQMSGILIGGGSKCDCYNNKIFDGKGDGIDVLGLGYMKIFNNLIVRAGKTYKPGEPTEYKHGIYVGQVVTTLNSNFKLYNNTIVSPKTSGIKYANYEADKGYIINNLITDPGELDNVLSYIDVAVSNNKVELSNNFMVSHNSMAEFLDFDADNFDLKPGSSAVNYGTSLTNEGITFDIDDRFRPFHTYFDAGAYECHDPTAAINEYNHGFGIPYPVPAQYYVNIPLNQFLKNKIVVKIVSLSGKIVLTKSIQKYNYSDSEITIDIANLKSGKYIINISTNKLSVNRPLLIVK